MKETNTFLNKVGGILTILFAPILIVVGLFVWAFYVNFKADKREIDRIGDDIRSINKC